MGSFPALLLLLALPGSCMPGEDTQVFLQVEGDSFRANCSYDVHKHLREKKFWCKELSEKYCPVLPLSFPSEEGINPNRARHRPVQLRDFGGGWFSVFMAALRREDSGTYQCGVWVDLKQILLQRIQMVVSPKEPVMIFAKKGKSLFLHCSYSVTVNVGKLQHFMWCKMVSRARCQPIIRANADLSIIKVGRTEMMNDFSWKMIRVWLKNLQLNDSGEYHLESHFQGRNKLLKRIMLKVLGENWKLDASPTDASKKDQRTLYAVMVLSSFLATTALIATVTLLVTSYIRRKRAGKGMDFGRHPDYRKGVLQKDGRKKASRTSDGDKNDCTTYAVLRHQPQAKPEDVTYVNVQPSPKVLFHLEEPPGNSVFSGPVEYATVFFRATAPHSGIEKEKNRST
ncbi:trem-like transcript 1 protein isoform X1 [Oxyura jamaicensis]|uniref:trem-like transcript 1 protein isoform X1 n=1 Tax=Oxyura jamaicensis TaxID=8884 RepID=UPI0015A4F63D|nr:trem-like transcript 1 protein isoform X1 [Oxyura jamaicensis]